ncbi:unnamed protein product, partial [Iphiclides podalirius]
MDTSGSGSYFVAIFGGGLCSAVQLCSNFADYFDAIIDSLKHGRRKARVVYVIKASGALCSIEPVSLGQHRNLLLRLELHLFPPDSMSSRAPYASRKLPKIGRAASTPFRCLSFRTPEIPEGPLLRCLHSRRECASCALSGSLRYPY